MMIDLHSFKQPLKIVQKSGMKNAYTMFVQPQDFRYDVRLCDKARKFK